MVIDLSHVHRLETAAVELFRREACQNITTRALVFCGVTRDSAVHADLRRGGLRVNFGAQRMTDFCVEMIIRKGPMLFEERTDAVAWCKSQSKVGMPLVSRDTARALDGRSGLD